MLPKSRPGEVPEQAGYDKNDFSYGGRSVLTKRKDIRVVFPAGDSVVKGRILPSFDHSLSPHDEGFPVSWVPYRDKDITGSTGHPSFNYWFYDQFEVYRFWGPQNRSFLSPRTKIRMGLAQRNEILDPIDRMNDIVRKNPDKWGHLSAHIRPSGDIRKFKPLLTLPQDIGFCNFFGTAGDDTEPSNFLLGMSGGGFNYIMTQLQKFTVPGTQPRDENWPTYLLGDVTHPLTGLKAWSGQKALSSAGRPANVMFFSNKEDFLSGHEVIPVTPAVLKNRCNFLDTETVMHIPSLEEMVEWILEVPEIPTDLLREAVGGRITIPDKHNTIVSTPTQAAKTETSAGQQKPLPFVSKVPTMDEDVNDDIPWKTEAPVPTTTKEATPLTPEEESEFEVLSKFMAEGKMADAGPHGYARYFELVGKASGQ